MDERILLLFGIIIILGTAAPILWFFYHQVLHQLRGTMLELAGRLDELEHMRAMNRNEIDHLNMLVIKLVVLQERWIVYAKSLAAVMHLNKMDVPPSPDEQNNVAGIGGHEIDDQILQANLYTSFNRDELNDLAFNIGLDADQIRGETREERARELIAYCRRKGKTAQLRELILKRDSSS